MDSGGRARRSARASLWLPGLGAPGGRRPASHDEKMHQNASAEENGCPRAGNRVFLEAVQQAPPNSYGESTNDRPGVIHSESELEDVLTQPTPQLIEFIRKVSSPLLVLGAGGKMGPTLAVLARRAADAAGHKLEVVAVSRFSDTGSRRQGLRGMVQVARIHQHCARFTQRGADEDVVGREPAAFENGDAAEYVAMHLLRALHPTKPRR